MSEKFFNTLIKLKLLVSKTSDSCFQGFDFFQMLLACYKYYKYLISLLSLKENKQSSQVGWIFKSFRSMHIMGELQTNKANFLFKKTQDFYQTTHAATH